MRRWRRRSRRRRCGAVFADLDGGSAAAIRVLSIRIDGLSICTPRARGDTIRRYRRNKPPSLCGRRGEGELHTVRGSSRQHAETSNDGLKMSPCFDSGFHWGRECEGEDQYCSELFERRSKKGISEGEEKIESRRIRDEAKSKSKWSLLQLLVYLTISNPIKSRHGGCGRELAPNGAVRCRRSRELQRIYARNRKSTSLGRGVVKRARDSWSGMNREIEKKKKKGDKGSPGFLIETA